MARARLAAPTTSQSMIEHNKAKDVNVGSCLINFGKKCGLLRHFSFYDCKGFHPVWCDWVRTFVQGGNLGIKVNDQLGSYFQTRKGLRQGDPLSPILFNVVVDMLAIILSRAKEEGQIKGLLHTQWKTVCLFCNMQMTQFYFSIMILNRQKT